MRPATHRCWRSPCPSNSVSLHKYYLDVMAKTQSIFHFLKAAMLLLMGIFFFLSQRCISVAQPSPSDIRLLLSPPPPTQLLQLTTSEKRWRARPRGGWSDEGEEGFQSGDCDDEDECAGVSGLGPPPRRKRLRVFAGETDMLTRNLA